MVMVFFFFDNISNMHDESRFVTRVKERRGVKYQV